MSLVLRSNYGDDSLALIAYLSKSRPPEQVYVVYIETGWAAKDWTQRVLQGEAFAKQCGFTPITLHPKTTFSDMVKDRKRFPSKKFQWCAGFLKGLPLLDWLDEHDPALAFQIALPKRQALYRIRIPDSIPECEYHGDRTVIHPILHMDDDARDSLLQEAGFSPLHTRSKECDPCVNSTVLDIANLRESDLKKTKILEEQIGSTMFMPGQFTSSSEIDQVYAWACLQNKKNTMTRMDAFSMGCGDPFGCGL